MTKESGEGGNKGRQRKICTGKLLGCTNQDVVNYFLFECWWKAPRDVVQLLRFLFRRGLYGQLQVTISEAVKKGSGGFINPRNECPSPRVCGLKQDNCLKSYI